MTETVQPALTTAVAAIPNSHKWSDRAYFVPFDGTAQSLTQKLIEFPGVTRGGVIVVRVAADYYGYSSTPFWDWLASAFREQNNG